MLSEYQNLENIDLAEKFYEFVEAYRISNYCAYAYSYDHIVDINSPFNYASYHSVCKSININSKVAYDLLKTWMKLKLIKSIDNDSYAIVEKYSDIIKRHESW